MIGIMFTCNDLQFTFFWSSSVIPPHESEHLHKLLRLRGWVSLIGAC